MTKAQPFRLPAFQQPEPFELVCVEGTVVESTEHAVTTAVVALGSRTSLDRASVVEHWLRLGTVVVDVYLPHRRFLLSAALYCTVRPLSVPLISNAYGIARFTPELPNSRHRLGR